VISLIKLKEAAPRSQLAAQPQGAGACERGSAPGVPGAPGGVHAWGLASKSLQADGCVSNGCTKRTELPGSSPTPACTYVLPPLALIPSSMKRVPGGHGPLLWASERPLCCLLCRVRSSQGSLKVPPAGPGLAPSSVAAAAGLGVV